MAKFRRKPTEIEAFQWFPGVKHAAIRRHAVVTPITSDEPFELGEPSEWRHYVMTAHEQAVYLEPGDWIIAEPVPNRYYPCKPDIFAATYEPA